MKNARVILSAVVLALLLPTLAAAEPSPVLPEMPPAVEAPACDASLAQSILLELPALPGQPAKPMYAACDWACTDQCDEYYQDCIADCPGYRGDPCLTSCRSGRIACYQSCGCL